MQAVLALAISFAVWYFAAKGIASIFKKKCCCDHSCGRHRKKRNRKNPPPPVDGGVIYGYAREGNGPRKPITRLPR